MQALNRPETGDLDVLIATVRILDLEPPMVDDVAVEGRMRFTLLLELTNIGLTLERLSIKVRARGLGVIDELRAVECRERIDALRPYWPADSFLLLG